MRSRACARNRLLALGLCGDESASHTHRKARHVRTRTASIDSASKSIRLEKKEHAAGARNVRTVDGARSRFASPKRPRPSKAHRTLPDISVNGIEAAM